MTKKQFDFIRSVAFSDYFLMCSNEVAVFIGCLFALESNYGTSHLAKDLDNYTSMKQPIFRITISNASFEGWAIYDNLQECIFDFLLWLSWNHFHRDDLRDLNKFKNKLVKCGYCPESDYVDRILAVLNSYDKFLNSPKIFNHE